MTERLFVSEMRTDVLVVGGGLGGVAAAWAVARHGRDVILTEETDWLGGQCTTQATPPDEHPWIEQFGCTATYRMFRDGIRQYYRTWYPLTTAARATRYLNPGAGKVAPLCHEPKVAVAVINGLLAGEESAGRLRILRRHRIVDVVVDRDSVTSASFEDLESGSFRAISADYFLDATETGEVLPLSGTEYVTGFESQAETDEPHAPATPQPDNMQPVTVCFAVDYLHGQDHTIEEPADYRKWRDYRPAVWPDRQLSWEQPGVHGPVTHGFEPNPDDDPTAILADQSKDFGGADLWLYRRIAARRNFAHGAYASDISLINWPQNDYLEGNLYEVDADEAARNERSARQLSLSLLYWMQTEAPRPDGGVGYPGLRLRGDVMGGTPDGLAKSPYIRESRRIQATFTIREQDVQLRDATQPRPRRFGDSVGVGCYRMDLHASTGGDAGINLGARPYEIPLGSLIPVRMGNLLPAAKNIGTTHITNGCYRLHPTEWNIGESAALLAVYCLEKKTSPRSVAESDEHLEQFQDALERAGVELQWPEVHGY